jgi:hypothetical protein
MAKGTLRKDKESGLPILVITNQLQLYCHHEVEEETEEGIKPIKIRPTSKFINELNVRVLELLDESIKNARSAGRMEIQAEDVPNFVEV